MPTKTYTRKRKLKLVDFCAIMFFSFILLVAAVIPFIEISHSLWLSVLYVLVMVFIYAAGAIRLYRRIRRTNS